MTVFYSFQLATLPFMAMVVEEIFDFPCDNKTLVYVGLILLGAMCTHIVATIDVLEKQSMEDINWKERLSRFY